MIASQPKTSLIPGSKSIKSEHDNTNNTLLFSVSYALMGIAIFLFIKNTPPNEYTKTRLIHLSIGTSFAIIGLLLRLVAIRTLGKHFTANLVLQKNHQLITSGIFRKLRHPVKVAY